MINLKFMCITFQEWFDTRSFVSKAGKKNFAFVDLQEIRFWYFHQKAVTHVNLNVIPGAVSMLLGYACRLETSYSGMVYSISHEIGTCISICIYY